MEGVNAGAAGKPGGARARGRRAKTLLQYANKPIPLIMHYVSRRPVPHALVLLGIVAAVGCGLGSQFAIKDAPILLFDEATSALDSASEEAIQRALDRLMKGRTVVAIAHRLSTLQSIDRIAVIQHARLVDDGTPNELSRRAGIFRDVLLRQERRAATGNR